MDADWVGSAPRYPVGQVRVATLPGVEVGSVIRTVTVRSQTNAPFFWLEHHFGSTDPVNEQSLEVVAPNTLALHPSVEHGDHVQQQIVSNATTTCYRWSATSLPATPPEDQLPPWRAFRASVLLSSGNWRDYANAVQSAFERAMTDQTSSVARAQQLTHGLHGDMAQLRAVRDYVAEAVREDGPDYFELPLSCLTPSDQTLADGYGHAADKSLLLTALLRARGFNARPILVGDDRHAISADFDPLWHSPQPHFFGDVLVKVALTNQTLYLGDTDQYAEPGATYHEKYHVLNDDGTYSLVDTAKKTSIENAWTLDLSSNGTARITLETRYFGTACGEFRKLYAEMPPEQRRRHFQELVSGISQSARPVGEPVTDLTAYPGRRVVTVDVPRYAVREGQTLTLLLPGAAVTPIPLRADQRISPLLISSLLHDVWSCRVLLPPETIQTPVLPPAGTWQLPASLGTVTCSTEIKPGARTSLVFHRDTQLGAAMIAPDLYPALLEMNRRMTHPGMKTVVIRLQ